MPPKAQPKKQPRSPLTTRVPPGTSAAVRKAYKALAEDLAAEGYACQSDWRAVLLAAETQVAFDRLSSEVAKLESLTTTGQGGERSHPLLTELKATRKDLLAIYSNLLLTPRSRSASRMTESQARSAAAKADDMEDFLGG